MVGKPEPILFAVAVEIVYLAIAPAFPIFRQRAASRFQQAGNQVVAFEKTRAAWLSRLDPVSLQRAEKLGKIRKEIIEINRSELSKGDAGLLQEDLQKIDSLFLSYLRLLFLKKECEDHLALNTPESVRQELEKLSATQSQSSELQAAVDKNVEILKKRVEHLSQIQELPKNLEMRLSEIENSLKLVADEVITMKGKPDISQHLNTLLADAEATEEMARETGPTLAQMQQFKTA